MNKEGEYLNTHSEATHWATIKWKSTEWTLLEGLDPALTGWASVNLFVPMTCESAFSQF